MEGGDRDPMENFESPRALVLWLWANLEDEDHLRTMIDSENFHREKWNLECMIIREYTETIHGLRLLGN